MRIIKPNYECTIQVLVGEQHKCEYNYRSFLCLFFFFFMKQRATTTTTKDFQN